jgi:hypothetical protein
METTKMRVWCHMDSEYVIATDREDAESALIAATGVALDAPDADDWSACDDAREFVCWFIGGAVSRGAMCEPHADGGVAVRLTFAEWAARLGGGYFCTTEF